jgi:uncharacterized membrane protein
VRIARGSDDLIYLGFVAFLPFPTALLGNYFHNRSRWPRTR